MLRYKLRTLLILLAVLPPLLWVGWTKYTAWKAERVRQRAQQLILEVIWTQRVADLSGSFRTGSATPPPE